MDTEKLGQSSIELSTIGLGTNYVGGHNLYANVDEEQGVRLVERAVELGITHLDTADAYGFGRSEELVGKAIEGNRDSVVLASKGGILFGEHGTGANNAPHYLRAALERSLKRLNTDYIDLYYIHRYDDVTPVEDSIGAMMEFKREGLIRAVGVSNFALPQLQAATAVGQIDALQSRYNLLQRETETEVLPFCEQHNISFIPWGGLAYGLLGGRYTRDFKLDENDWRHRTGAFDTDTYAANLEVVDKLKALAAANDTKPGDLAIQWLLSRPGVSSVIAGAKSAEQVEANAAGQAHLASAELLDSINALT